MIKIPIPINVYSNYEGYSFFIKLYNDLKDEEFKDVYLDFSDTAWFDANLCAVLGAIITEIKSNINNVYLINLKSKVEDVFSKNFFMASFGGSMIMDFNNTTIKYRRNKIDDEQLIKEFILFELLRKKKFPKLSNAVQIEIIRSIFEIYSNAVIHGNCDFVYSCGQFYPNNNPPRIDFTIVDLGKSIQKNVNEYLNADLNGKDAIKWALAANNTTKPISKNIPGGLGFKIIKDFVELNKGKIQIVSGNGYWEYSNKVESFRDFPKSFQGTIVNIEFNLDDTSIYHFKNENVNDIKF
ncbi:MAG: ATP-binding protein [Bacteroidota bacterium]